MFNKSKIIFLVFVLSLVSLAPAKAAHGGTIHWLIWELSPEFVRHGDYAGKGYADRILKFFIKNLPEYHHQIEWTAVRRWEREMVKSHRCTPYVWGHFFRDKLAYSRPYTVSTPHVAIFNKKHQEQLGPPETILSLADLLKNDQLSLMTLPIYIDKTEKEPRYPILHPLLAPYQGKPNLIELDHGTNEVDLRLVERGRADYALGYPTSVIAQQRDRGAGDSFVVYGLKEHQQYKEIHAACMGDAFGKEVIVKLDKLLTQKTIEEFLIYQEEWNGGNKAFRKQVMERVLPNAPL